jgi:hypothetical protein
MSLNSPGSGDLNIGFVSYACKSHAPGVHRRSVAILRRYDLDHIEEQQRNDAFESNIKASEGGTYKARFQELAPPRTTPFISRAASFAITHVDSSLALINAHVVHLHT